MNYIAATSERSTQQLITLRHALALGTACQDVAAGTGGDVGIKGLFAAAAETHE